jgi:membrane-associated phospholipid phosphatase
MRKRRALFPFAVGLGLALAVAVFGLSGDASAEQAAPPVSPPASPAPPQRTAELRYSLPIDVPVTVGGAAFVIVTELDKANLAPKSCTWCERSADGSDTLNGFDAFFRDAFVRRDTSVAATTSDIFAYGVAPASAVGFLALGAYHEDRNLHNTPVDLLVVAEATALAMDVNQVVKLAVSRERPYFHFASADARAAGGGPDSALSFYSLHTSATFALAVSAGTVAEMRGYSIAPLIWASGLMIGTATGYMRIAADKHYMTDTLTGAAAGSLIGFTVPYFFHKPSSRVRLSAHVEPGGGTIGAAGVF